MGKKRAGFRKFSNRGLAKLACRLVAHLWRLASPLLNGGVLLLMILAYLLVALWCQEYTPLVWLSLWWCWLPVSR